MINFKTKQNKTKQNKTKQNKKKEQKTNVTEEKDWYVVLCWDEVKIKEGLVLHKQLCVNWFHRSW